MNTGKITKLLSLWILCLLSLSCSSDFEAHIMSKPIPVVYGIINPNDSLYQVRLTKSFIGPGNAYTYAQKPDSLYYDGARVFFESRNFKGKTIDKVELLLKEIEPREEGVFVREPNLIYQTDFNSIRLRQEILERDGIPYNIDLFVFVEIPGINDTVQSQTRLKTEPAIINPKGNFQKVYFYSEIPFFMEWIHNDPGTHFEIKVVMRYKEILEEEEREKEVYWVLRGIEPNEHTFPGGTRTIYSYHFRPENFYSHIRAAVPFDPEVKGRLIRNIDFIILTSDGAVKDYNDTDLIADDYNGASYSNIINGLGLFSSYNTEGVYNQRLGQRELDSLAYGKYTKHLRFSPWE